MAPVIEITDLHMSYGSVRAFDGVSLTVERGEVFGVIGPWRGQVHHGDHAAIGRQLAISEATVKTHLVHLFSKLDVTDRTAAVTVAVERGLIRLGQ
jgi:ABC-type Na+ transport system ATPase subunit NatA